MTNRTRPRVTGDLPELHPRFCFVNVRDFDYLPRDASHNGKALIPIAVSGEAVPAMAPSVRLHLGKLLSVERHNGRCLLPINEKPIAVPRTIRRLRGRGGCFLCRRNPLKRDQKLGFPQPASPCSRLPWPGSISSTFSLSF